MLVRSLPARALAQSRYAQPLGTSMRHLSMAARPSAVALGKRPALAPRSALLAAGSIGASRNISWNPFKPAEVTPAEPIAAKADEAVAAAAPVTPAAPAAPVDATAASISTPLPSSDIPATPAEHALAAPQHLTSTAPDHHFHSDPTPLLPQSPANAATPTLQDLIQNSGLPLDQVLNSPEAVHAAMKVSDLKLMGLEHGFFNIAGWLRDALVGMHSITGLPWWASIIALTLSMRLTLFPLLVRITKHNVRMSAVQPQMAGIMKRMSDARAANDQMGAQMAAQSLQTLMKTHDVSPFRSMILPIVSMPLFLGLFFGLRKLATLPLPQLHEGGFGWVTDLTLPDPYFILPVTSICFQILVFAMGADGATATASSQRTMAHFRNVFIVASPLMLWVVSSMPAAVLFYWTTTNTFTALQAWLLRQAPVKALLNIPTPTALPPPPNDAFVDPNPGIKDTFNAIIDMQKNAMEKARQRQAEAAEHAMRRERLREAARPGSELPEKVVKSEAYKATRTASFLEAAKKEGEQEGTERLSAAEIKARRVAEARRKRMSRQ